MTDCESQKGSWDFTQIQQLASDYGEARPLLDVFWRSSTVDLHLEQDVTPSEDLVFNVMQASVTLTSTEIL